MHTIVNSALSYLSSSPPSSSGQRTPVSLSVSLLEILLDVGEKFPELYSPELFARLEEQLAVAKKVNFLFLFHAPALSPSLSYTLSITISLSLALTTICSIYISLCLLGLCHSVVLCAKDDIILLCGLLVRLLQRFDYFRTRPDTRRLAGAYTVRSSMHGSGRILLSDGCSK